MNIHNLKKYQLKATRTRLDILNIFQNNISALSEKDIEKLIKDKYDRATIYRTLNTFYQKRILHKIIDSSNTVKYALCSRECSSKIHCHDHLHFKCEDCNNIYCFNNFPIATPQLPKGYSVEETNFLIMGVCKKCNFQRKK